MSHEAVILFGMLVDLNYELQSLEPEKDLLRSVVAEKMESIREELIQEIGFDDYSRLMSQGRRMFA